MFLHFPPLLFPYISFALAVFLTQLPSYLVLLTDFLCSICVSFLVCFRLTIFCLLILVNSGAFCVEGSITLHKCEISWNSMYLGRKMRLHFGLNYHQVLCFLRMQNLKYFKSWKQYCWFKWKQDWAWISYVYKHRYSNFMENVTWMFKIFYLQEMLRSESNIYSKKKV